MSAIAHTAKPTVAAQLDPLDLYNVRSMLSDEERLVQDSVGKFVDDKVIPIIGECFEEERFPRELVAEVAELGLLGSSIHGYGCAGLERGVLRADLPGAGARRFRPAQLRLGAVEPVHVSDLRVRQRGAEAEVAAAAWRAVKSSAASGSPSRMAARTRRT